MWTIDAIFQLVALVVDTSTVFIIILIIIIFTNYSSERTAVAAVCEHNNFKF